MKKIITLLIISLSISIIDIYAQNAISPIDSLSENLYKGSNRYSEEGVIYRVIQWRKLQSYFNDIKALDADKSLQLEQANTRIQQLKNENKAQQEDYVALNQKYEEAITINDSMKFGASYITKSKYNLIMWTLVLLLAGVAVALSLMHKRSNILTKSAKKELEELHEEYEGYRKRALKREQEVASSYQREINKLRGVM